LSDDTADIKARQACDLQVQRETMYRYGGQMTACNA